MRAWFRLLNILPEFICDYDLSATCLFSNSSRQIDVCSRDVILLHDYIPDMNALMNNKLCRSRIPAQLHCEI